LLREGSFGDGASCNVSGGWRNLAKLRLARKLAA
jgi:hypothetical protein